MRKKVRVNTTGVPRGIHAHSIKGQIIEVEQSAEDEDFYQIVENDKVTWKTISKGHTSPVLETIKVRVADEVPISLVAHNYRGQIVEVVVEQNNFYRLVENGKTVSKTIDKRYATPVEEETMKAFEPQSGMTFEVATGQRGLFIGTENGLWMMFAHKATGEYTTHTRFREEFLGNYSDDNCRIVKVYRGMGHLVTAGFNSKINTKSTPVVWESEQTSVVLNDNYTAHVGNGFVEVGCQEISFEKVLELAKLVEKKQAK